MADQVVPPFLGLVRARAFLLPAQLWRPGRCSIDAVREGGLIDHRLSPLLFFCLFFFKRRRWK